jgi:hypothetical protein
MACYIKNTRDRDEAILKAYQSGGIQLIKQIGDYFDLHYLRVSRTIRSKELEAKSKT